MKLQMLHLILGKFVIEFRSVWFNLKADLSVALLSIVVG